jgi:hypothetical protein
MPLLMIGGTQYFDPFVLALWLSEKEPSPGCGGPTSQTA